MHEPGNRLARRGQRCSAPLYQVGKLPPVVQHRPPAKTAERTTQNPKRAVEFVAWPAHLNASAATEHRRRPHAFRIVSFCLQSIILVSHKIARQNIAGFSHHPLPPRLSVHPFLLASRCTPWASGGGEGVFFTIEGLGCINSNPSSTPLATPQPNPRTLTLVWVASPHVDPPRLSVRRRPPEHSVVEQLPELHAQDAATVRPFRLKHKRKMLPTFGRDWDFGSSSSRSMALR